MLRLDWKPDLKRHRALVGGACLMMVFTIIQNVDE